MSVFSSGKRSSVSKYSGISNSPSTSNLRLSGRIVVEKSVRFEIFKNLDVKSVLQNVHKEEEQQKDYEKLIRTIQNADGLVQDADLIKLFTSAKDSVQFLDEKLKIFVQVLLAFNWNSRSYKVIKAYQDFILALCKVQPCYNGLLLEQLVQSLTKIEQQNSINEWINGHPPTALKSNFKNIHDLITTLLVNNCITTDQLIECLWKSYPHHNSPCSFLSFTHNLLEVTLYAESIRKQIFNLILQKLIHLDTLVTKEDIEKSESDYAESILESAEIFNMEDDSMINNELNGPIMHHKIANLLDLCMMRFFKYIYYICYEKKDVPVGSSNMEENNNSNQRTSTKKNSSENELSWDRTKNLFSELLNIFETLVLPTHGITHVPFIMFYLCSFKLNIAESFIEFLWKKIMNKTLYNIYRHYACYYVSSILIHANFMPVRVIKTCLNEMAQWLHNYLDTLDLSDEEMCSPVRHPVFYSVCQALFTVITYKHTILVDSKKNMKFLQSLNLQRLILSSLNPLRSCNEEVVSHFAFVTKKYQIAYCYNVIHQNARLNILPIIRSDHLGNITKLNTMSTLENLSPFSLFLLERCKSIITPVIYCDKDFVEVLNDSNEEQLSDPSYKLEIKGKLSKDDEDDFLMSVESPCNISMNMSV